MAAPYDYTPQTYDKSGLVYQNGKIYYQPTQTLFGNEPIPVGNPVEVRPFDLINYTMPGVSGAEQIPVQRYAGAFSDLSELFPKVATDNPWQPYTGGQSGANPYAINLTPEQRFDWFISDPKRFNTLFGEYAQIGANPMGKDWGLVQGGLVSDDGPAINPYEYSGQAYTPYNSEVGGHEGYAAGNAQYVLGTLRQFFPNKTDAELAKAATDAIWDTSNQRWREGRAGQAWYYAGNPNDYVRQIAAKMGGLSPEYEALLASTDQQMAQQGAGYRTSAHAADDAATQARAMRDLTGALGVVGGAYGLSSLLNGGLSGLSSFFNSGSTAASSGAGGVFEGITGAMSTPGTFGGMSTTASLAGQMSPELVSALGGSGALTGMAGVSPSLQSAITGGGGLLDSITNAFKNIDPSKLGDAYKAGSSLLGGSKEQPQQQSFAQQPAGGGFNMKINPYQLGLLNLQQPAYQNIFGE